MAVSVIATNWRVWLIQMTNSETDQGTRSITDFVTVHHFILLFIFSHFGQARRAMRSRC